MSGARSGPGAGAGSSGAGGPAWFNSRQSMRNGAGGTEAPAAQHAHPPTHLGGCRPGQRTLDAALVAAGGGQGSKKAAGWGGGRRGGSAGGVLKGGRLAERCASATWPANAEGCTRGNSTPTGRSLLQSPPLPTHALGVVQRPPDDQQLVALIVQLPQHLRQGQEMEGGRGQGPASAGEARGASKRSRHRAHPLCGEQQSHLGHILVKEPPVVCGWRERVGGGDAF